MKARRLTALILLTSMTVSLAGCSKNIDFGSIMEDMKYEEIEDFDEDDIVDLSEDGLYLNTEDNKNIRQILEIESLDEFMRVKAKDLTSSFFGTRICEGGGYEVYQFVFETKDEAEEAFENLIDSACDGVEDMIRDLGRAHADYDEGDDYFTYAFSSSGIKYGDIWLDGNVINFIYGKFYYTNDAYDDFVDLFEAIDRDTPEDLIEDELRSRSEIQNDYNNEIAAIVDEINQEMEG